LSKNGTKEQKVWLRDLAVQTLEAYRNLNSVAADAAFVRNSKPHTTELNRASEILEAVIAEIKGTSKSAITG
jgi:hypothetical protein